MTRFLQVALAGLCAGLLLIIAAELFVANQDEFQTAEVPPRTPDASKTFRPAFDMESAIAIILERPLFSPTRDLPDPPPDHNRDSGERAAATWRTFGGCDDPSGCARGVVRACGAKAHSGQNRWRDRRMDDRRDRTRSGRSRQCFRQPNRQTDTGCQAHSDFPCRDLDTRSNGFHSGRYVPASILATRHAG